MRICDICYLDLTGINKNFVLSAKITRNPDKTILFGDFRYVSSKSIVWIELQEDYCLHVYGAKLDQLEDFSIDLTELTEILLIRETRTFVLKRENEAHTFSMELNHQITYPKNDYIDENIKNTTTKFEFYLNLWYETMTSARLKILPSWYSRKRDSADSGISDF